MTPVLFRHLFAFISFVSLTLLYSPTYSQDKISRELVAQGGAKAKIRPDLVTFSLTVEKMDTIEARVIEKLNHEVDDLVKALLNIGFTDSIIKISDYNVSSSLTDNNQKRYTALNSLKLDFGLDTKLINQIYNIVQAENINDLDISYETKVSDSLERRIRQGLVQQAIAEAKAYATNVSKAMDMQIIGVKQVSKFQLEILEATKISMVKFTPPRVMDDNKIAFDTSFDKFQVEDVELEETITITFEIKK